MKKKIYYIGLVAIVFILLSAYAWLKKADEYSDAERRPLEQFPVISVDKILNGKLMTEFEDFSLDQFPLRERFRKLKAFTRLNLFAQKDNNDIYKANGHLSKLEYPMYEEMLDLAGEKFEKLYQSYLKDTDVKVYFSIVPDKNYYLAAENGYLSMDYDAFYDKMQSLTPYMQFIDLRDTLSLDDYYETDTHWRQEALLPVANKLVDAMNGTDKGMLSWEYETVTATEDFNGVYVGQYALKVKPDPLNYLTNEKLQSCIVTSYSSGKAKEIPMYSVDKVAGKDPYEMFLNGSEAVITIENPNAESNGITNKELVVFRDSFGSSLIPLLVENYAKITVLDIRYMSSDAIENFVEFTNQDVLFLYSTLVLNSSTSLRIN